jgi:hypothetical protein
VKVDQARRDVATGDIDYPLGAAVCNIGPDRRDLRAGNAHVQLLVCLGRWVENGASG